MAFVKAQRQRVSLKMAVTGPSGSGKTFGALRLAFGLVGPKGRVALIDTENGSGSLYANLGDYDVLEIAAPFTVQKYTAAIQEAVAGGYEALIIDSLSHAWAGDGGLLDQKSAKDSRGGNGFSNWADISKVYEQFKSAILQSPIHIIGTMRSKQDYVIESDSRGKQTPRKVGMAPIQREGMEYEFTTVFDVDMTHTAATSKDRTGLFTDEISQLTEDHGRRLSAWLAGGAAPRPAEPDLALPETRVSRDGTVREERTSPQERQAAPPQSPVGMPACGNCGKALTKAQQEMSVRNFGEPLCPNCQRDTPRLAAPGELTATPDTAPEDPLKVERREKVDEVLGLIKKLSKDERDGWQNRFTNRNGTTIVKNWTLSALDEAIAALKSNNWPHEGEYQEALDREKAERGEGGDEADPFEAGQAALLDVPGKGHGDA